MKTGAASIAQEAEGCAQKPDAGGVPLPWDLYRHGPLLLVAAIATLGLLSEGQMANRSGIYLHRALELSALVGGSGVAVFFGAMTLGRLATGWTVSRLGNRKTLMGAGLLAASRMALDLATTEPAPVVGGFLLVGLTVLLRKAA